MNKRPFRRTKKLINSRLQLRMVLQFVGLSLLSLLFYYLVVGYRLSRLSEDLGMEDHGLIAHFHDVQFDIVLLSVLITLPMTLAIGILVTFRIAGPLYRFDVFLRGVLAGHQTEPCRIRKEDELHDLCEVLNDVTAASRKENAAVKERGLVAEEPAASVVRSA